MKDRSYLLLSFLVILSLLVPRSIAEDCNGNGIDDVTDIRSGELDCDEDGILDSCQLAENESLDVNKNNFLDRCEGHCNETFGCDDNGLCFNGLCYCYPGYSGIHCSNRDPCFRKDCGTGSCDVHSGSCVCPNGLTGERCQLKDCGPNGFHSTEQNVCMCIPGYEGSLCNECSIDKRTSKNETFVCCPTENTLIPYILVSLRNGGLIPNVDNFIKRSKCVMPDLILLDCNCRLLLTAQSDQHVSNAESYLRNSVLNYNQPRSIGRVIEILVKNVHEERIESFTQQQSISSKTGFALFITAVCLVILGCIIFLVIAIRALQNGHLSQVPNEPSREVKKSISTPKKGGANLDLVREFVNPNKHAKNKPKKINP